MKKIVSMFLILTVMNAVKAVDNNTVEIVYNGNTAIVTIANNISNYVSCSSGTSSHVVLTQSSSFGGVDATKDNEDGEIIYVLKGTSSDGEFYLTGSFKCSLELNGLILTNSSGPAINIQNGKRVSVSAKKETTNTLTDGANDNYNGCYHCKGHTKFKGKGILNVVGNSKHGVYSKEYIEIKNLTLNITSAKKDGIHCKEYFLLESGSVNISGVGDDGIQVELDGTTSTGELSDHEDEDSGNFYMVDGILSISDYKGKAVHADGSVSFSGGTQNFDVEDISSGILDIINYDSNDFNAVYNLHGAKVSKAHIQNGLYIIKTENGVRKIFVKACR